MFCLTGLPYQQGKLAMLKQRKLKRCERRRQVSQCMTRKSEKHKIEPVCLPCPVRLSFDFWSGGCCKQFARKVSAAFLSCCIHWASCSVNSAISWVIVACTSDHYRPMARGSSENVYRLQRQSGNHLIYLIILISNISSSQRISNWKLSKDLGLWPSPQPFVETPTTCQPVQTKTDRTVEWRPKDVEWSNDFASMMFSLFLDSSN